MPVVRGVDLTSSRLLTHKGAMAPEVLLPRVLFLFGVGFLVANVLVITQLVRFQIRKRSALLIWDAPKPRFFGFSLGLGVVLGLLLAFKLVVQHRAPSQVLGEGMMFVYYGYAFPLSTSISRGFYRDGVWSDTGFMRWGDIAAVAWQEDEQGVTLILVGRRRQMARRLWVPGDRYGETRRMLRDQIKAHAIHIGGTGLDLGSRDEGDMV